MTSWQAPARAIVDREWDVAVVGCGPAGAIAAMQLARNGVRVVALERHAFPRDKVCGDALIADATRVLERAGALERVRARSHSAKRLLIYSPSGIEVPLETGALVIRRETLDAMLAEMAVDAGATVAQARVVSIDTTGDRATLHVDGAGSLLARIVILATGVDTRLLATLGMLERPLASGVAVRCYVRSSVRMNDLVISFEPHLPGGYAWIFPLGGGDYNIGCGLNAIRAGRSPVNLADALDRFIRTSPVAREISSSMVERTAVAGATLRSGLTGAIVQRPPNVLAIGESIGTTFPLSGEGIGKAMETAERAASLVTCALESNDLSHLESFAAEIEKLKYIYRGYAIAQNWMARPWLNNVMARAVRRSPYVLRQLEGIVNETVDPRSVFSMRGVWNMLTR
jgi:geranylgeranyl reductase family protein